MTDANVESNGWPCHSSQKGLIEELLSEGIKVTLTYEVKPVNEEQDAKQ